jgi:hypothetical protein
MARFTPLPLDTTMTTFTGFLWPLLFLSLTLAQPLRWPSPIDKSLICRVTHLSFLCPRTPPSPISAIATINTPLGSAQGLSDVAGVFRYTVKYGSASRWGPSTVVESWQPP